MSRMMAVVAALALGGAVAAQDGEEAAPARGASQGAIGFSQIDTNRDNVISKTEWLAFFGKLDSNRDGKTSAEEFGAVAAGEAGARKKSGDGERKGGEGQRRDGEGGKKGGRGDGGKAGNREGDR